MQRLKIKKFSTHIGVPLDTIKHYQDCGILTPEIDTTNNYRYYNMTHAERIIVSRRFRNLGFSIEDTKQMISRKNGQEIQTMFQKRYLELQEEIERLENNKAHLESLIEICNLFNQKAESYDTVMRPGYFYYPHTVEDSFVNETMNEELAQALMSISSHFSKLMIVPYFKLTNPETEVIYHSIAIKENHSTHMSKELLEQLTYIPSGQAIRYIYSRPFSKDRFSYFNSIYEMLLSKGYSLSKDIIYIENGVDFYCDGIRYENYFIYFPLQNT